jgi:hypothetical protein
MVRKVEYVKQGDLSDGSRKNVHLACRSMARMRHGVRTGVRNSIVALKHCNECGAKGDKEVDT